jgi:hypothetical protein
MDSRKFNKIRFYMDFILEPGHLSRYIDGFTGWTAGVQFSAEGGDFSLLHSVQTGSGAHPVSYQMGTGGSFSRFKEKGE